MSKAEASSCDSGDSEFGSMAATVDLRGGVEGLVTTTEAGFMTWTGAGAGVWYGDLAVALCCCLADATRK